MSDTYRLFPKERPKYRIMKKYLIFLLLIGLKLTVSAQTISDFHSELDTSKLVCNAKLMILNLSLKVNDLEDIIFFLEDDNATFESVNATGFDNFIFFKLSFPDGIFGRIKILEKGTSKPDAEHIISTRKSLGEFCSSYTFAYQPNSNLLFKLDGTVANDFFYFYWFLERNSPTVHRGIFNNKNDFINQFWIENINMECLYKTAKARGKEQKNRLWYGDCSTLK